MGTVPTHCSMVLLGRERRRSSWGCSVRSLDPLLSASRCAAASPSRSLGSQCVVSMPQPMPARMPIRRDSVAQVETKPWKITQPSRNLEIELTTISSNHHVEINPSDAGNNDRYVVQEIIKAHYLLTISNSVSQRCLIRMHEQMLAMIAVMPTHMS